MKQKMIYPRSFSHVGLTVTNIDFSIDWYKNVLGFNLVAAPVTLKSDNTPMSEVLRDLLGNHIKEVKIARLSSSNGIGIELFEFINPRSEKKVITDYWKEGIFHISITDPNIEETVKRIEQNGGKQRSKIWEAVPGTDYKMVFCEDPDGHLIEIYSHSMEMVHSNL